MEPKQLSLGEVVFLKWIDSRAKAGWQKPADAVPVGIVYSIGFVVATTDEYLTISTSLHADDEYAYDPISIPWGSIKSLIA